MFPAAAFAADLKDALLTRSEAADRNRQTLVSVEGAEKKAPPRGNTLIAWEKEPILPPPGVPMMPMPEMIQNGEVFSNRRKQMEIEEKKLAVQSESAPKSKTS